MEKYLFIIIPVSIFLVFILLWSIQAILNLIHKPYLDEQYKNTNTAKIYIYQRGRGPGSYNCFTFKKKNNRWHYVWDKTYLGLWAITYIITLAIIIAIFCKTGYASAFTIVITILSVTLLFVSMVIFEIFFIYLTLKRLLKENNT